MSPNSATAAILQTLQSNRRETRAAVKPVNPKAAKRSSTADYVGRGYLFAGLSNALEESDCVT